MNETRTIPSSSCVNGASKRDNRSLRLHLFLANPGPPTGEIVGAARHNSVGEVAWFWDRQEM